MSKKPASRKSKKKRTKRLVGKAGESIANGLTAEPT